MRKFFKDLIFNFRMKKTIILVEKELDRFSLKGNEYFIVLPYVVRHVFEAGTHDFWIYKSGWTALIPFLHFEGIWSFIESTKEKEWSTLYCSHRLPQEIKQELIMNFRLRYSENFTFKSPFQREAA